MVVLLALVPGLADGSFPGTNGRVAVSDGSIFTVGSDGSGRRELGRGLSPTWSPNGRRIAFVRFSAQEDSMAVFSMRVDGREVRRLTPFSRSFLQAPIWCPRGRSIAYAEDTGDLLPTRVGVIKTVRDDVRGLVDLTGDDDLSGSPSWSPDCSRIAYRRTIGGDPEGPGPETSEIWVMGADGSGKRRLTFNGANEDDVAWSPDGGLIAFVRDATVEEGDAAAEIWTVRPDGGDERRIAAAGSAIYAQVRWSPDGTRLLTVRTSSTSGRSDVLVLARDGSRTARVANGPSVVDWSPDGTRILLGDGRTVWVAKPDGTARHRIALGGSFDWQALR